MIKVSTSKNGQNGHTVEMVYQTLDALESMSPEDLARLVAVQDEEIDYSDIPPSPPEKWEKAIRGGFIPPSIRPCLLALESVK